MRTVSASFVERDAGASSWPDGFAPRQRIPNRLSIWLAVDHGLQKFSSSDREWACDLPADKPTGNLDSKNSEIVLKLLADLNRRLGQTMLLITHNPDAAAYAHRTVTMRDGQIVAEG